MAAFDFRPRSNTELLDASVEFTRMHFGPLAATVALMQIPALGMALLLPTSPSDPFARWRDEPAVAVLQVVISLWLQAMLSVTFVALVDDMLHGRGGSLAASLRLGFARSASALLLLIIKYVVLILWALLFFFPAIWAFARYFATEPAFVVERMGPLAAIHRSKQLAKGNNGRAIALALLPIVIVAVIGAIVQQGLLGSGVSIRVIQTMVALLSIVLYPFVSMPAIFLYYDLRTRREGLDLDFGTLPTAAA